jgi:hypothetical protein
MSTNTQPEGGFKKRRPEGLKDRILAAGPGLTVAVIALIVALAGGAFAASHATQSKKSSKYVTKAQATSIAKKYAGKEGPPGSTGPQGAAGVNGKDGTNGTDGIDGTDGTDGTDGANGKSVVLVDEDPFNCPDGGYTYKIEDSLEENEVCNGADGEDGSPWTAGGVLPVGATETGSWTFTGTEDDTHGIYAAVSFPIPFPFNVKEGFGEEKHVHFGLALEGGAFTAGGACPSESFLKPEAKPGELCVYENPLELEGATFEEIGYALEVKGYGRGGARLRFIPTEPVAFGSGSYAITGCTPVEVTPTKFKCAEWGE